MTLTTSTCLWTLGVPGTWPLLSPCWSPSTSGRSRTSSRKRRAASKSSTRRGRQTPSSSSSSGPISTPTSQRLRIATTTLQQRKSIIFPAFTSEKSCFQFINKMSEWNNIVRLFLICRWLSRLVFGYYLKFRLHKYILICTVDQFICGRDFPIHIDSIDPNSFAILRGQKI